MDLNQIFELINYLLFHLFFSALWLWYFYRWLHKKNIESIFKASWLSYLIIVIITVSGGGWFLYHSWSASQMYAYLLPPHSNYFYLVIFRTVLFHLISLAAGLVLYYLLKFVARLAKATFVELKEIRLLALGAVLAGWNNVMVYLTTTAALMLLTSVFINLFKSGRGQRLRLAPYVFLALIFTLLIGYRLTFYLGVY
ncbi:TPA: hypothetical protein DCL28_00405 [Candidatus Komeilibacteria bacterium]|nr:MAG: hypothetical protein UW91_C0031G0005 [Parcubacteria group bacterium GW2011_GWF2_45_11]KKT98319.1 MAG: hypothetical protein UW98_C0008G0031 [Parcubacteria group bacterium GW2011_GWC2_45_15]OGY93995.1 MAG: hypothetical protein A3J95_02195 [Candidatus Komeilibacteria bacterium RIFOXYC2_FULL_45_12]OGY94396.1 MAG: hypothetical protein A2260_00655 [Candidatus Komeilibacteria bacterium RIFOXYA2_FULL_45_9]HAH04006.1 hypothetical protein [Candidatus Komeilibacteria bacterium]